MAVAYRQNLIIEAIHSIGEGYTPAVMRDLLAPYFQGAKKVGLDVKES